MSPSPSPRESNLLAGLAATVRSLRKQRGWPRSELASRSGLSVRFLARVESGEGNISIVRLETLARALGTSAQALLSPRPDPPGVVALVGLRGAGKSTVGPRLAEHLGVGFVEIDSLIVEASGLPLAQLFELHGEPYYRRLERQALVRLLDSGEAAVVAAAGGVVNDPATWKLLLERSTVVWLRATAEEHWSRVVDQGDRRPMGDNPAAMEELRALLHSREPVYAEARLEIGTTGRDPDRVAARIAEQLLDCDSPTDGGQAAVDPTA